MTKTTLDSTFFTFGQTNCEGLQIVCSIGYHSSWEKDVLIREDDSEEAGIKLVTQFIEKMVLLQQTRFKNIPKKIIDFYQGATETLKDETIPVKERIELESYVSFLRKSFQLIVVGHNSGRYDLPVLLNLLLKSVPVEKLKIIKKGSSFFSLAYENVLFLDSMNFFPGSLEKFASSMKVEDKKGYWPYEYYKSISEIKNAKSYPPISAFHTSLKNLSKNGFWSEFEELFPHFQSFSQMMIFFGLSFDVRNSNQKKFPNLSDTEIESLLEQVPISPKIYYTEKNQYDMKIADGTFSSMLCLLREYNEQDCQLLYTSLEKFDECFRTCFNTMLFSKLSLPGLSESILWNNFDQSEGLIFSFGKDFGHLNERVRSGLLGGPVRFPKYS